ncbi:cytochrome c biogenesis protein CcsA [Halobellus limi]|uniref:Cytochrome C biogenesis protein n=1 Tax=Halobellus limi TaxID=699433 RepID=A0A1H5WH73_9EURY|nr:cytochrome c biogenesis protein CcsA [Halobellus limi]QCC46450.1 cytochrome C biogenesis protein [Halobellus limi]SEF98636.1 cytochrome c-type biogenesis protein CcmF [Halobellus limi]
MNPGTVLLALAFLAGLTSTSLLARAYLLDDDRYLPWVPKLTAATAVLLVGALSHLTYQFVSLDYSNAYVWENTAAYLSVLYRVTGVYAANEGSVLLWASIVAVVALIAGVTRGYPTRRGKLVHALTVGVVTYFAAMLLLQSPFASVRTAFPNAPPGFTPTSGQGLNPLLVDPYMAIHPPVMFVSYALLTMPFAIGAAHFIALFRGDDGLFSAWIGSVTRWLRLGWLFLTAAVALGGLWSYTVLGWGGIWAWDPVETAILIPWLFLTATLHAVTNYRPGGRYRVLAPAMTASVFALAVYTTSVVRSGVFRSIHSFADGGIGASFLVLMGVTTLLGVVLPLAYWMLTEESDADASASEPTEESRLARWITRSNLLHLAVLLFGLLTFVSLWGLSFPVLRSAMTGLEVSVESRYYNLWSYPLVLAALLLLGFYMDYDREGLRRSLVGLAVFGLATLVGAAVAPSETWRLASVRPGDALVYQVIGGASALSVLPPVAYAILGTVKRTWGRIVATESRDAKLKETGITLIHVGAALLVLSLPFMYLFAGQASVMATGVAAGAVDTSQRDVGASDYDVRVLGYERTEFPTDPEPGTYALSSSQVLTRGQSLNTSVQTVHGTVTAIREGPQATVVQLDDSQVWIGVAGNGTVGVETGQEVVARGQVMWEFVPTADVIVLAGPETVGPAGDPPDAAVPTRVIATGVSVGVYDDSGLVVSGVAGQREYPEQGGLQVRDVLIDRGALVDTYVIAGVSDGTASMSVKRIPFVTLMRLSILSLLLGMLLVFVFDPKHGVRTSSVVGSGEPSAGTARDRPEGVTEVSDR